MVNYSSLPLLSFTDIRTPMKTEGRPTNHFLKFPSSSCLHAYVTYNHHSIDTLLSTINIQTQFQTIWHLQLDSLGKYTCLCHERY